MNKKFSTSPTHPKPSFRLSQPPSFDWFRDLPAMNRGVDEVSQEPTSDDACPQAQITRLREQLEQMKRTHFSAIQALETDYERRLEDHDRRAALQILRMETEQRELLDAYQDLDLYAARLEADRVGARHAQAQLIGERDRARREVEELRELLEQHEGDRISTIRNPFSELPGAAGGGYPESAIHRVSSVCEVLHSPEDARTKRRAG